MWPFRRKLRSRRLELRRTTPAVSLSLWQRFRDAGGVPLVLLGMLFLVVASSLDIWPIDPLRYREDMYVPYDVYARVDFRHLPKENVTKRETDIRETTPAIFTLNQETLDKLINQLKAFPDTINIYKTASQPTSLPADIRDSWAIDQASLTAWREIIAKPGSYTEAMAKLRLELVNTPVVSPEAYEEQRPRRANEIVLVQENAKNNDESADHVVPKNRLITLQDEKALSSQIQTWVQGFDPRIRSGVAKQLMQGLAQPLYSYDASATQKQIASLIADVKANPPKDLYVARNKGDLLVQHDTEIKKEQLDLLAAEHSAWLELEKTTNPLRPLVRALGRATVVLLITVLMFTYILRYERDLLEDHWRGLAVVIIMLLVLGVNKACMVTAWSEQVAVLTVMMGAVILTIAYNQRFALFIAILLALLTTHQLRLDVGRLLILLAGSVSAVLQLRDVRSRSKLIEVGAVSAAVVLLAVMAVSAAIPMPFQKSLFTALWAAGAALLVGFLVQGILPLIEKTFHVATSMTLLEWTDPSKPLLRRLAMEAPGTFNHSLQLGMMCEAAADAIDARGLLARAGAYYHDVGKINKPEYFVENQAGAPNPHQKLSPAMSLLIIIGHVKDGLEMAREYSVPDVLREFIVSHHGTTLVQYFYHAATEQRKADADRAPDEVEFRYPGPKPRIREAAILMLADAAESSVRAMPDPTPGRIEMQVHSIVTRRLMDGQLDQCDLTLREVHQIEASLIRSLNAMYHGRIAYPRLNPKKPCAPSETPAAPVAPAAQEAPHAEPVPAEPTPANNDTAPAQPQAPATTEAPRTAEQDHAAAQRQHAQDKIEQSADQ